MDMPPSSFAAQRLLPGKVERQDRGRREEEGNRVSPGAQREVYYTGQGLKSSKPGARHVCPPPSTAASPSFCGGRCGRGFVASLIKENWHPDPSDAGEMVLGCDTPP